MTTNPTAQPAPREPAHSFEERLAGARGGLTAYAKRLVPAGQGLAGVHRDHEDLVQDALQRALTRRESFDVARPILPWLKRLLLRVYLDHRKRLLASPEGSKPEQIGEATGPGSHDLDLDLIEQAEALLDRLEQPERGILDRFHRRGESIAEIARALDLPAGTVKSHLHRARRRLRGRPIENENTGPLEAPHES